MQNFPRHVFRFRFVALQTERFAKSVVNAVDRSDKKWFSGEKSFIKVPSISLTHFHKHSTRTTRSIRKWSLPDERTRTDLLFGGIQRKTTNRRPTSRVSLSLLFRADDDVSRTVLGPGTASPSYGCVFCATGSLLVATDERAPEFRPRSYITRRTHDVSSCIARSCRRAHAVRPRDAPRGDTVREFTTPPRRVFFGSVPLGFFRRTDFAMLGWRVTSHEWPHTERPGPNSNHPWLATALQTFPALRLRREECRAPVARRTFEISAPGLERFNNANMVRAVRYTAHSTLRFVYSWTGAIRFESSMEFLAFLFTDAVMIFLNETRSYTSLVQKSTVFFFTLLRLLWFTVVRLNVRNRSNECILLNAVGK